MEEVLGEQKAPYFGPTMYYPNEAIELWAGNRGLEEYAREVFPVEEATNGMTWMDEENSEASGEDTEGKEESEMNFTEGL